MDRKVPVWFVMLVVLAGLIFTMVFAWATRNHVEGNNRFGAFGAFAAETADFPRTSRQVMREIIASARGTDTEIGARIRRDLAIPDDARPVETAEGIGIEGLLIRESLLGTARPGWRKLVGAFMLDGELKNAAVLLSPDHRVVHYWHLTEEQIDDRVPRGPNRKFPHGVEIVPMDGSIIYTFDGSIGLHRLSACGDRIWTSPGRPSHAVTLTEDQERAWIVSTDFSFAEVDLETGEVLRDISIFDVNEANPDINPLELRRLHNDAQGNLQRESVNLRGFPGKWMSDYFHLNDVDPLPPSLADAFPQFEVGDVMLSLREINLVIIVDPDTLKIKWWRAGAVQRQHDPDWMPDGRIMVYNNRMSEDYSNIVWIDPRTYEQGVLYDGRANNFYSRIRGKSQPRHDDNSIVITSSQQGRGFEVSAAGDVTYEIISTRPGDAPSNYVLSEMRWYPPDTFTEEMFQCTN
ncbi:MAG: arylsulfotransferase family protein [Pseudomonadota bacterium]